MDVDDAARVAAADQAHAAAEEQLDRLIVWWSGFVAGNADVASDRCDQVSVLARVLYGSHPLVLAASLAAAVCRMSANTHDG